MLRSLSRLLTPEISPLFSPSCSSLHVIIHHFLSDLLQYAPDKVQKILVGNKADEVDKRQVATEQGSKVGQSLALWWNSEALTPVPMSFHDIILFHFMMVFYCIFLIISWHYCIVFYFFQIKHAC